MVIMKKTILIALPILIGIVPVGVPKVINGRHDIGPYFVIGTNNEFIVWQQERSRDSETVSSLTLPKAALR
jgi:hypothetical protein